MWSSHNFARDASCFPAILDFGEKDVDLLYMVCLHINFLGKLCSNYMQVLAEHVSIYENTSQLNIDVEYIGNVFDFVSLNPMR